jgi:hypothetical protein
LSEVDVGRLSCLVIGACFTRHLVQQTLGLDEPVFDPTRSAAVSSTALTLHRSLKFKKPGNRPIPPDDPAASGALF